MVEFMVLSAPRSGSTWVANWLTTERVLCLHDPILEHKPEDLDALTWPPCRHSPGYSPAVDRLFGIACTGLGLLTAFVNAHPARKVIVHRDFRDINESLMSLGLTRVIAKRWEQALNAIDGMHVQYADLFQGGLAEPIYEHLTHLPFDAVRHEQLKDMHIEPMFDEVKVVPERAREFRKRVTEALA
jgi:hypothetical protein